MSGLGKDEEEKVPEINLMHASNKLGPNGVSKGDNGNLIGVMINSPKLVSFSFVFYLK